MHLQFGPSTYFSFETQEIVHAEVSFLPIPIHCTEHFVDGFMDEAGGYACT